MKKFTKGALITCLVLFLTGVVVIIGGVASAGPKAFQDGFDSLRNSNWFHMNGWNWDLHFGDDADWDSSTIFKGEAKDFVYDKSSVDTIAVDSAYGRVDIKEADTDKITVKVTGKRSSTKYSCVLEDGELVIKGDKQSKVIHIGDGNAIDILITVPAQMKFKLLDLDFYAGEVFVDLPTSNPDQSKFNVDAGQLTVTNLNTTELTIDIGAGEMDGERLQAENAFFDCGMGEMSIEQFTVTKKLTASVGMGEITMNLSGQRNDYNYDISCGMGNLDVGDQSYSGISNDTTIDNDAQTDVKLDCGMGNVEVNFEN